jgi:hypothetical protein
MFIYIHILSYILSFVFDVFREECLPLLSPKKHIVSIYLAYPFEEIWYESEFTIRNFLYHQWCSKMYFPFSCNGETILLIERSHSYNINILTLFSIQRSCKLFHTHCMVLALLIIEEFTVSVKCRTAIKALSLYLNLCLGVKFW